MNYYELEAKYGVEGALRICKMAEQFTNQVRISEDTAVSWAVAQYELSLETTQGKG